MIPENIKNKIEEENERRYGIYEFQSLEGRIKISTFKSAAEYGYILAQEEMERLKGLIEKMFKDNCVLSHQGVEDDWHSFKQTHKL